MYGARGASAFGLCECVRAFGRGTAGSGIENGPGQWPGRGHGKGTGSGSINVLLAAAAVAALAAQAYAKHDLYGFRCWQFFFFPSNPSSEPRVSLSSVLSIFCFQSPAYSNRFLSVFHPSSQILRH